MEGYSLLGVFVVALVVVSVMIDRWWQRTRYQGNIQHFDDVGSVKMEPSLEASQLEFSLNPEIKPMPAAFTSLIEEEPEKDTSSTIRREVKDAPQDILMLSVIAKAGSKFVSYDLLQAIFATGMQFGNMKIFHYYQQREDEKVTLFSLASATKPGDFDLDRIGDFSCPGLVLFMDLANVLNPQFTFKLMLGVAEQLAEDLDGELHADPRTPWSERVARQYQQKISLASAAEAV